MAYGSHEPYLDVSLPSLYKYATLHNYDLFIPSHNSIKNYANHYKLDLNRPYSWHKIPIMLHLIESGYENILWIDADVVINKFDKDILSELNNKNFYQSFVVHETSEGFIPNCGVWIVNKISFQFLLDIWNQNRFISHPWWEQKANMHMMHWDQKNKQQLTLTDYGQQSIELPYEWNVHKNDYRFDKDTYLKTGRFLHATMWNDRFKTMKEWTNGGK